MLLRSLVLAMPLSLVLAGCATAPPQAPAPSQPQEQPRPQVPAQAPADTPRAEPEVANLTPLPSLLLIGEDAAGRYYSMVAKATFTIESDGRLTLADQGGGQGGEPVAPHADMQDQSMSTECKPYGAVANQRTTWFPYTGVFVRGGTLVGAQADGADAAIKTLTEHEGAQMLYTGKDADPTEYYYAPCVGAQRVATGWRLDRYLPDGGQLRVRADARNGNGNGKGQTLALKLPKPFAPFVLVRYQSGAMIPVPMRAVLATVDLPERRVVLQFQGTYAVEPAIRKMELRLIVPGSRPSEGETAARHAERTQAQLRDLARCAPPKGHAIEPCANPQRTPDPLIFYSSQQVRERAKRR
ncbi:hypothetical protein ACF8PL_21915 [Delftia sp. WSY_4]|uniref:hypothetical protein n=1 Tax=unclassified Delftia TaxID=2613839 RepID=UPI00370BB922